MFTHSAWALMTDAMPKLVAFLFLLSLAPPLCARAEAITPKSFQGTPSLVAFWRSDCAPCMAEMKLLPALAKKYAHVKITLISLQDKSTTESHLPAHLPANITITIADTNPEETLKHFGDTKEALPFSVFLYDDGTICKSHYGIVGTELVDEWIEAC